MPYEVKKLKEVNFGATGIQEILQNVGFILRTVKYSCPMDRDFGWVPDLDAPIQRARAVNIARITQAIHNYEPRAIVEEVKIEGDFLNGELEPIVRVRIDESI
ncbi:GPW/gp25 family protein [Gracilibacillus oryzae]|uniref:GPW/gp25 family protein n=1 Tax=Gracilibacillus oryzae TaxID=1672701 RepID=A0A7C8GQW5_9BACI|nr:GPW/gp25 family protein [Gracilibacillus oryzae]KAB8126899.1 GPW/gp25 family protein [Gracilibacillus oryzae]